MITWLIWAMPPDDLAISVNSFFSIWVSARITELYTLGTKWALMVNFGTPPQIKQAPEKLYRMHTKLV